MDAKQLFFRKKKHISLNLTDITLLSIEEYLKHEEIIHKSNRWWWLRSEENGQYYVTLYATLEYNRPHSAEGGVRPALIGSFGSAGLKRSNKVEIAGYTWTILSENIALCDQIVGTSFFREDSDASDKNDYEKSDIRRWIYAWANMNLIKFNDGGYKTKPFVPVEADELPF